MANRVAPDALRMARPGVVRVSYPRASGRAHQVPALPTGDLMPKAQLRERIQELLGELDQVEAADPDARDRLAAVLEDIRTAVEDTGEEESESSESLLERLNEAARQFEESHPTLVAMVGRVAESLSNLGI
jgi:hypothetical protein